MPVSLAIPAKVIVVDQLILPYYFSVLITCLPDVASELRTITLDILDETDIATTKW